MNLKLESGDTILTLKDDELKLEDPFIEGLMLFELNKDNIPLLITYLKGLLQQLKNESNEAY